MSAAFHNAVRRNTDWTDLTHLLGPLGWAVSGANALTALTLRSGLRPYFGLIERLLYATMIAWFLIVAIHLASPKQPRPGSDPENRGASPVCSGKRFLRGQTPRKKRAELSTGVSF